MLQGQRDLSRSAKMLLSELAPLVSAQQGVIYQMGRSDRSDGSPCCKLLASYADSSARAIPSDPQLGEGLVGQCAAREARILITDVPPYVRSARPGSRPEATSSCCRCCSKARSRR
jgi:hypothetical protein